MRVAAVLLSSRRFVALLACALLSVCALGSSVSAQLPTRLSDRAELSLITIAPGDEVHTLFGHGALRVVDPTVGLDACFNYGTFDFDEGFVLKFMRGELDYYLSVYGTGAAVDQAISKQRSVVEQVLDLDAAQRQTLYSALVQNAQPENRTYRYDFLFDNCSTRLVDILRSSLGPGLVFPTGPYEPRSFRTLLDEHVSAEPWLRFGFALLLGATVDDVASFEESWFLPRHFRDALADTRLDGRPLVGEERELFDSGLPELPPASFDQPLALAWGLLALAAVLSLGDRGGRLSRSLDALLFALLGAAGLFLAGMWGATLHHVTSDNWNLVWALLTHLPAAFFLARANRPSWLRVYLALAALTALLAALTAATGFGLPQTLSPAILPLGLLIALRAAINARLPRTPHSKAA